MRRKINFRPYSISRVYRVFRTKDNRAKVFKVLNGHISNCYTLLEKKKSAELPESVISAYVPIGEVLKISDPILAECYRKTDFRITIYKGRVLYRCICNRKFKDEMVTGLDLSFSYHTVLFYLLVKFKLFTLR